MDEAIEQAIEQIEQLRKRISRYQEHLTQIEEDLQGIPGDLRDATRGLIAFAELQHALDWGVLDLRTLQWQQAQLRAEVEPLLPSLLRESRRCRNLDLAWEAVGAEPGSIPVAGRAEPEVAAILDFGLRLFRHLAEQAPDENVFISPLGIALTLAMAANGAQGATRRAAAETLNLSVAHANAAATRILAEAGRTDEAATVRIANSLWHRQDVQIVPAYRELLRGAYDATVRSLDYLDPDAVDAVNAWVDEATWGLMRTALSSLDPAMPLYLLNAVAFKGAWTNPFDPADTSSALFTCADGRTKSVPMMHQTQTCRYFENERFQLLRLPYGSERIAMYVILPEESTGLGGLLAHLTSTNWCDWLDMLGERRGGVALPRFRAEYGTSLLSALAAVGPGAALTDQEADFSGVVAGLRGPIVEAYHKGVVEVDELGTRAAAATVFHLGGRGPAPFSMRADRPFCFAIRDEDSGVLLFLGAITDPEELRPDEAVAR
jgi:serpin B